MGARGAGGRDAGGRVHRQGGFGVEGDDEAGDLGQLAAGRLAGGRGKFIAEAVHGCHGWRHFARQAQVRVRGKPQQAGHFTPQREDVLNVCGIVQRGGGSFGDLGAEEFFAQCPIAAVHEKGDGHGCIERDAPGAGCGCSMPVPTSISTT